MLNPGGFYTMTDTLRTGRLSSGTLKVTAELGIVLRQGRVQHSVCGKKIVNAAGSHLGYALPRYISEDTTLLPACRLAQSELRPSIQLACRPAKV